MKKIRLDYHLAHNQLSASREKAKSEIMAGWVKVNGETVREPKRLIAGTEAITIERPGGLFVSRGGAKLSHALSIFNVAVEGKVIADLGASTGGFTDCLLKAGASLVYAIDVGYGQLDFSLRNDPQVIVLERTNVKDLKPEMFSHKIDFLTADLSFISITKVFDKIKELFAPIEGIILLKPQFEANPGEHKKGVVRKAEQHTAILTRALNALIDKNCIVKGLGYSPIKGPAGNIEFLLYFAVFHEASAVNHVDTEKLIADTVSRAHAELG